VVAHTTLPDAAALRVIRGLAQTRDPDIVLSNLTPLSELAGATIATRRMAMVLLAVFAALALALSALGMYGVMSYAVSQRTAEIGIRMAIGAGPWDILRLITGQGLRTALAGTALGLLGALAAGRALGTLLYGVNTMDVTVYSAIAGVAVLVSLTSSFLPARRALGIDPLVALRKE
jgi:putative ABC transport system permease protein